MLLERETELESLAGMIERARGRAGAVALIEGPPGIGKSRLLAATGRLAAEEGLTVLRARGGELEREFAFGVVRQLFEPVVSRLDASERATLFSGAAALSAPLLGAHEAASASPAAGDVFPLLHGLYWLCVGLSASGPLLIAVDDAHWADDPSLLYLHYLARRLEDLPVLAVVAIRSTEPVGPVDAIRDELVTTTVRPAPLSEAAAGTVVGEIFGCDPDPAFARAAHEASGGNPFLLTELSRGLSADGCLPDASATIRLRDVPPSTISRWVLARLGSLPVPARAIARAVAVLAGDAYLRHVAALAGVDEPRAAVAADGLVGGGFLERGSPLRFAHPLIRAAVYGELGDAERAQMHRRAASLLAAESASPEHIAAHLLVTEPGADPDVVEHLRAAAMNAYAQGAPQTAGAYLRRALLERPEPAVRPAVLLELGRAESAAAHPDAAEHLLEAFGSAGDPATRALAAEAAAPFLLASGRSEKIIEILDDVLGELTGVDPDRALQLQAQLVGAGLLDARVTSRAASRLENLGSDLHGATPGERMMLCHLAYHRTWRSRDADAAVRHARDALSDGRLIAERGVEPPELSGPVMALVCADRLDEASAVLDTALSHARGAGSGHAYSFVSCGRALLAYRRGAMAEAEAEARAGMEITLASGLLLGSAVNAGALIRSLVERGALDAAHDVLGSIGMADGDIPDMAPFNILVSARGQLHLARGDIERGMADLLECGRRNAIFGIENPVFVPWRTDLALAHRMLGDVEAARALADEELAAARAWGTPGTVGSAGRLQALLCADPREMIDRLRGAVELLARSPARLERARALADLGAANRRANRRAEAREPLREALDLAQRCGATVLAEHARSELVATGARPRRLVLDGVDALTASELRVAKLAADGLSNPEIAQALFVTRKTVETHLGRTYGKLRIRSRDELPRALSD